MRQKSLSSAREDLLIFWEKSPSRLLWEKALCTSIREILFSFHEREKTFWFLRYRTIWSSVKEDPLKFDESSSSGLLTFWYFMREDLLVFCERRLSDLVWKKAREDHLILRSAEFLREGRSFSLLKERDLFLVFFVRKSCNLLRARKMREYLLVFCEREDHLVFFRGRIFWRDDHLVFCKGEVFLVFCKRRSPDLQWQNVLLSPVRIDRLVLCRRKPYGLLRKKTFWASMREYPLVLCERRPSRLLWEKTR